MTLHSHAKKPKLGTWLVSCDVCGIIHLNTQIKKRWDNLYVCESDWEANHPQKLIKLPSERIAAPFERVESVDGTGNSFIPLCTVFSNQAVAGAAEAGCSVAGTWRLVDQGGSLLTPPVAPTPSPPTDPYFANVVLLTHFNGINGATTFTDNSQYNNTVSAVGSSVLSTANSKFNTGSLLSTISPGGALAPNISAYTFGSNNFTIEGWSYFTSYTDYNVVFSKRATNAVYAPINIYLDIITGNWGFTASTSGSAWELSLLSSTSSSLNTWHHWAVVRNGTTFTLYLNGNSVLSGTLSGSLFGNSNAYCIGTGAENGGFPTISNTDDVRVTIGIARYTTNFTPPTEPFPNS